MKWDATERKYQHLQASESMRDWFKK
jgi:hypothetical protein